MTSRDPHEDGPDPGPGDDLDREALRSRIRASASHARADRDLAFLSRPELRAIRLELEYLKPELTLTAHGVRHTIVVFGSTRLCDPEVARARLAEAEAGAGAPGPERDAALARARKAVARSRDYEIARELGRIVGRCSCERGDERLLIATGGGPGGMEAANRGAFDVGAPSVGLNIFLPHEQAPNPWITPELSFQFRYFALRKLHFMLRARALVALPGGYGTLDELFETLCLIQTRKRAPLPVVLVDERFWRRAIDFDFLVEEQVIGPDDLSLFSFAESAREVWDAIEGWYQARGASVFDDDSELDPDPDPEGSG